MAGGQVEKDPLAPLRPSPQGPATASAVLRETGDASRNKPDGKQTRRPSFANILNKSLTGFSTSAFYVAAWDQPRSRGLLVFFKELLLW